MCLARSTPHTGSSRAQGLWSEYTAKPQLAAPKGRTGPPGLSEASGLVSRRARRLLGLTWAVPVGAEYESGRQICKAKANKHFDVGTDYGDGDSATSSEQETSPARPSAQDPLQRVRPEAQRSRSLASSHIVSFPTRPPSCLW